MLRCGDFNEKQHKLTIRCLNGSISGVHLMQLDEMKALKDYLHVNPAAMLKLNCASKNYEESELEVLLFEFKAGLGKYLAGLGAKAPARSLKAIIEFNEKNRDKEMPYFGQELFLQAEKKGTLASPAYQKALRKNHRLSRTEGIDAVMTNHRLDAIIAPTGGPPWVTDLINGDHFTGGSSTPAAVAGYPNINVPAGYVLGLPVGISFFGRAYSEPALIKLAYAFEQATKHRKPPQFLPTADLR